VLAQPSGGAEGTGAGGDEGEGSGAVGAAGSVGRVNGLLMSGDPVPSLPLDGFDSFDAGSFAIEYTPSAVASRIACAIHSVNVTWPRPCCSKDLHARNSAGRRKRHPVGVADW